MAKRSKKNPDATTQVIIDAIRGGRFTSSELTFLHSLVDVKQKQVIAEQRLLSTAGALGEAHAWISKEKAKQAPKKRGRPRLPDNHKPQLNEKHFKVLARLAEAGEHGLMSGAFKIAGLTGRSLHRVLSELRDRFLADLEGKRWYWTPTGERLNTGQ